MEGVFPPVEEAEIGSVTKAAKTIWRNLFIKPNLSLRHCGEDIEDGDDTTGYSGSTS